MSAFLDSSALVKRYINETGSTAVRTIQGPVVVSQLARVEVASTLRRLAFEMGNTAAGQVLERAFLADWHDPAGEAGHLAQIQLRTPVLERAAALVGQDGLPSVDAIQLASALLARAADPQISRVVTFDARLASAALEEGFAP